MTTSTRSEIRFDFRLTAQTATRRPTSAPGPATRRADVRLGALRSMPSSRRAARGLGGIAARGAAAEALPGARLPFSAQARFPAGEGVALRVNAQEPSRLCGDRQAHEEPPAKKPAAPGHRRARRQFSLSRGRRWPAATRRRAPLAQPEPAGATFGPCAAFDAVRVVCMSWRALHLCFVGPNARGRRSAPQGGAGA